MIQRKRITIIGIIIVGGIIITGVLALNGYFGGGAKIPEDTFTRGLVAYWSFDEGTGNIAYDISGNGNNCTIYGAKWTKGKYGSALQFDGVDDYVLVPEDDSLKPTEVTVSAWIYFTGDVYESHSIVRLIKSLGNSYGFSISKETGGSGKLEFASYNDGWYITATNFSGYVNKWTHIVGIYDGRKLKLYINGILKDSADLASIDYTEVYDLYIGSGYKASYFLGLIDEVRIYNRALSAEEIRYHYNLGRPVAHWRFDEGSGTTTYDSSGNEYHGILHE